MATTPTCEKCNSDDLLVVRLTPRDREMLFTTCRHCEHRWWQDAHVGADINLDVVSEEIAR